MTVMATLSRCCGRRTGRWLGMCVLLLIAALTVYYRAFPRQTLRDRLQQEMTQAGLVEIRLEPPTLLFPPGLYFPRADLLISESPRRELPLRQLRVVPLWLSLAGDRPGLRFRAELHGGTLTGNLRRNGETLVKAKGIPVREVLGAESGPILQGTMSSGHFEGRLPLDLPGERQLELTLEQIQLAGLEAYGVAEGRLDLGRLHLRVEGQGATLNVRELSLQGGALEGRGQGTLLLGPSLAATRLNLTLELRPGDTLDPNLRELLDLLGSGTADGGRSLRLSGSLRQPALR